MERGRRSLHNPSSSFGARFGARFSPNSGGSDSMTAVGRKHRPDYWLIILCLLMLGIGLIVVYSISPAISKSEGVSGTHYVAKQLLAIALSVVAFGFTSKVPLEKWRQLYKPLLIVAGVMT